MARFDKKVAFRNMKHDVFVSSKNSGKDGLPMPDSIHARRVYEALMAIGLKVFFSEESLAESGRGNFSRSIQTALESARIFRHINVAP